MVALSSKYECRWIFIHDDDADFQLTPIFFEFPTVSSAVPANLPIASHLLDVLNQYDPAVAGFPWDGASDNADLSGISNAFRDRPVCPLTDIDGGTALFRRDVLPMVLPFRPRGEGGVAGSWSFAHLYLSMLVPWALRETAVSVHGLHYSNTESRKSRDPKRPQPASGQTVLRLLSPEDPSQLLGDRVDVESLGEGERYVAFLRSGLKCMEEGCTVRFGRSLRLQDLAWAPRRAPQRFSHADLLDRLGAFFDLRHPAVAGTDLILANPALVAQAIAATRVRLSIHVFAAVGQRAALETLVADLGRATLPPSHAAGRLALDLHVHAASGQGKEDPAPPSLTFDLGPVTVRRDGGSGNLGPADRLAAAWAPVSADHFALFLDAEDRVSPALLLYADREIRRRFFGPGPPDARLAGLSLHNEHVNEALNAPTGFGYDGRPLLWTMPPARGAVWAPRFWAGFRRWREGRRGAGWGLDIEASFTNGPWRRDSRGGAGAAGARRELLRHMRVANLGVLYPNLPGGLTLVDAGPGSAPRPQYAQPPALRLVQEGDAGAWGGGGREEAAALPLWSPWGDRGREWGRTEAEFERLVGTCTVIVMSVRANLLSQSVPHYAAGGGGSGSRGLVSKVIVAWNNPDAEPPLDLEPKPDPAAAAAGHAAPRVVWVRMPTSSMNNRYALYDHVETECVVTVDDDLLIPHRATRAAFEAWRGDLFQQVVGHAHYARYHFDRGGEWAYGHDSSTRGWSLALAGGGAVYHRALLRQYASPRFAAGRALVDATRNCEDILLNVVATGLTGRGPAVVDALTWPERHAAQIGRAGGSPGRSHCGGRRSKAGMRARFDGAVTVT